MNKEIYVVMNKEEDTPFAIFENPKEALLVLAGTLHVGGCLRVYKTNLNKLHLNHSDIPEVGLDDLCEDYKQQQRKNIG